MVWLKTRSIKQTFNIYTSKDKCWTMCCSMQNAFNRQYYSYSVTCQPVESLVSYKAVMILNRLLQLSPTKNCYSVIARFKYKKLTKFRTNNYFSNSYLLLCFISKNVKNTTGANCFPLEINMCIFFMIILP